MSNEKTVNVAAGEIPDGVDNAVVESGEVITKQKSADLGEGSWDKE